ncbi:beta-hexosaminidase subunit alpha-like [Oppia nitens]|uniref:beta-hexosaminidase subunit alpha-like n=1 Tax=Oppia nitens TaxID=1686743 RepID=UPI0023DCABE5|nr:beta-hexosaminidase subunit alpha-like [Oppia nitens]
MKLLLSIFIVFWFQVYGQQNDLNGNDINLWPYPQHVKLDEDYLTVDPNEFNIILKASGKCDLLEKAIQRYRKLYFLEDCSLVNSDVVVDTIFDGVIKLDVNKNVGKLTNVTLEVHQPCESEPYLHMSEMYSIEFNQQITKIFAETNWGAIRALETLSQLIRNVGKHQFIVNVTAITDYPRFAFRGVMLDTSRHYVPIREIQQNLDAMAYNKFNVFHWHIVDDQSFPYVSEVFPELSLKGAFNAKTHIYTKEEIQNIVDYAKERGIRVLVEFDSPGHTQSWGKGQPGLLARCYNKGRPMDSFGPIDPSQSANYEFIEKLFKEVITRFPDQYLHLGGDEVDFTCWASNPDILAFMKSRNITNNFAKLEEYYIQNVLDIVKGLNKSYIVWQEVFDNGVKIKEDTVVHVWKGDSWQKELFNVTKAGYQSIVSACWYLNYISYGTDWPNYYACDPQNFGGSEQQNKLVIGGEACMWGEWVDGTNVISRTWPRAIAVAERLWSSKDKKGMLEVSPRFNRQHCLMQQRGLRVQPANGSGFCQCDYAV